MTIEDYIAFLARGGTTTFVSRNPGIYGVNASSDPKPLCDLYGPPWDDFWERMIPRRGFSTAYRAYTRAVGVNVVGSAAVAASINAAMKNLCQNRRAPRRPGRSGQEKAFRQEERARDGRAAMTEYKTEAMAVREKAARLK